jgi:hypothetical protein
MAETLTVLFKIGHLPGTIKPTPAVIEKALSRFLNESVSAKQLANELSIPADTKVQYEVKWLDEIVEDPATLPIHLSIRGPRSIAGSLHDKLKSGLVDGGWRVNKDHFTELAAALGIPRNQATDFRLYVRSPTGEKFD